MKQIRKANFNKKTFKIRWEQLPIIKFKNKKGKLIETIKLLGTCDSPKKKGRNITLNPCQREKLMLNTAIHEAIHASDFTLTEKKVSRMADDISDFLWRIGARLNGGAIGLDCLLKSKELTKETPKPTNTESLQKTSQPEPTK